jgi:hypothetical protein
LSRRFRALPRGRAIFDRGPEDIEFYTLHYPKSIGASWDIEGLLSEELAELRSCRSNRIFYLSVRTTTLISRKDGDASRRRSSFSHHLQSLQPFEEEGFLALPSTVRIDVDNLNAEEVEQSVARLMEAEWESAEQSQALSPVVKWEGRALAAHPAYARIGLPYICSPNPFL